MYHLTYSVMYFVSIISIVFEIKKAGEYNFNLVSVFSAGIPNHLCSVVLYYYYYYFF